MNMSTHTHTQKMADELRAKCNKLTPAEREHFRQIGMKIIRKHEKLFKRLAEQDGPTLTQQPTPPG